MQQFMVYFLLFPLFPLLLHYHANCRVESSSGSLLQWLFLKHFDDLYFGNVAGIIDRHLEHVQRICLQRVTPGKHRGLNQSTRSARHAFPGLTESYSGGRQKHRNFHVCV